MITRAGGAKMGACSVRVRGGAIRECLKLFLRSRKSDCEIGGTPHTAPRGAQRRAGRGARGRAGSRCMHGKVSPREREKWEAGEGRQGRQSTPGAPVREWGGNHPSGDASSRSAGARDAQQCIDLLRRVHKDRPARVRVP